MYKEWLTFAKETDSPTLRGSMMDLHWFVNNASCRFALRDITRFLGYLWRLLRSPRALFNPAEELLFVVDTPGVGGVLTLLPLLEAIPASVRVTLAVSNFVHCDAALQAAVAKRANVTVLNIDAWRGQLTLDCELCRATFALVSRYPRISATVPLFLLRQHAYSAVARSCMAPGKTIALVVFNERMLPSASFSEVARKIGVPTVAVQHGNFVDNYLPVLVDRYLTWGRIHSLWLARHATCVSEVIGSPRMDGLRQPARQIHQWPAGHTVHVVFFSQVGSASVSPEMISHTRREILQLADNQQLRLTIKLHPLDTIDNWKWEGSQVEQVSFIKGNATLAEALADADLVCSFYSTVLAEALLWDLPTVQLNPYPDTVDYFPDRNGITAVASAAELLRLINKLHASEPAMLAMIEHQRTLREEYFSNLGTACSHYWKALLPTSHAKIKQDST
jgi:hypothetical protein